jgi:hypothetical protein
MAMGIVTKTAIAAAAAVMLSACASSGGGGSSGTNQDSVTDFMGCVMLAALGLICNAQDQQATQQNSAGASTSSQSAGSSQIQRTYDNTPAQPLTTWSELAGWKVKTWGLTTYVQYRQSPLDPSADTSARQIVSASYLADYWSYDYEHQTIVWYDTDGKLKFAHQFGDITDTGLAPLGQAGVDVGVTPANQGEDTQSPFASLTGRAVALMSNPHALGWEYQTFGVWNDGGSDFGVSYAESYGVATPGSAVPTSGNATFNGKLSGFHISGEGRGSIAVADITVTADFNTRTLGFESSSTVLTRDTNTAVAARDLDLSGSLTYAPGTGTFRGSLQNSGGTLSGPAKGRFYGPTAQELGGIFTVQSSTTVETLTGAFGAKR